MEKNIRVLLDSIKHPETNAPLHDGGFVDQIVANEEKVTVTLRFEKVKDPFALKLKKRVEELLTQHYPSHKVMVMIKEGVAPRKVDAAKKAEESSTTTNIAHVVAIASGKGGVGKSTVTANLAMALQSAGFRVGVLDADIYGPSQPRMFGVEGFVPEATVEKREDGKEIERIIPAESNGIKVMSIGFFINANDPLMWRGTMASNALKQLLHQTEWGALDFLLIDLPPGTGDIHLTILQSIKFTSAVIVSTPQGVAIADVVRGVEMFAHPQVGVKVAGLIENMAYFAPDDMPDKRYYIFGQGGASQYAKERGLNLLGEVPIYETIMSGGESGLPAFSSDNRVQKIYQEIVNNFLTHSLS